LTAVTAKQAHNDLTRMQEKSNALLSATASIGTVGKTDESLYSPEGFDVILTHPETGTLSYRTNDFDKSYKKMPHRWFIFSYL